MFRRVFFLLFVLVLTTAFIGTWSSGKPELWEGWEAHNPENNKDVDHADWNAFLKKYVRLHPTGIQVCFPSPDGATNPDQPD